MYSWGTRVQNNDQKEREKYQKYSKIAAESLNWEEQEHKLVELYDKVATNNQFMDLLMLGVDK